MAMEMEVAGLEFVLEHPAHNAMWTMLFARRPGIRAAGWNDVTTSYCKFASFKYRKTTRFLSSMPPSVPLPDACCPSSPCKAFAKLGRHPQKLSLQAGEEASRGVQGYYERSAVPESVIAGYVEGVAEEYFKSGAATRLLFLDLFAGAESGRRGLGAYQRRTSALRWANKGYKFEYCSVDYNEHCRSMILADLRTANLDDVVATALEVVGWREEAKDVAVLCWASPPCESYSQLTIGSNSCPRLGGPTRLGRDAHYRAVPRKRGSDARETDRMVVNTATWLHSKAVQTRVRIRRAIKQTVYASAIAKKEAAREREVARKQIKQVKAALAKMM